MLGVLCLSVPSFATETAGWQQSLTTALDLHAKDGTRFVLDVYATATGAGISTSSALELELRRCSGTGSCRVVARSRSRLPVGAVSISPDFTKGTLATTVAGLALNVTLTHSHADASGVNGVGAEMYPLELSSGGPSPRGAVYFKAQGQARWGSGNCPVAGRLSSMQGVDRSGNDVRDPRPATFAVPKAVIAELRTARC